MAVAEESGSREEPITIKKYANRRLYNTATSSYVTLDHLCTMVKEGKEFQVVDAKSGDDITRSVLTQIIFEEESKGQNLLPIQFLRQLISFYGNSMQSFLPSYLELSMEQFTRNQEQLRDTFTSTFGGAKPFGQYDEQIRQNMEMFERAVRMFSPFPGANAEAPAKPQPAEESGELSDLKEQLADMQAKIEELAKKK